MHTRDGTQGPLPASAIDCHPRWSLVFWVAVGCMRLPAVPGHGGPPWFELRSAHFTMWSDAPLARSYELVQQAEHIRSILYGILFPDLYTGGNTVVIALRDSRELGYFTSGTSIALPQCTAPMREPMLVVSADRSDTDADATFIHELAHAISHNAIRLQSRWFSEGLASYFETIDLDNKKSIVEVGVPPRELLHVLSRMGLLPADRIVNCNNRGACGQNFYASAWAFFAYLTNRHERELHDFMTKLTRMSEQQAWAEAFRDLPQETLDRAVSEWLVYGDYSVRRYHIDLQSWHVDQRALGDADVYGIRAMLGGIFLGDDSAEFRNNLQAAEAIDPTIVLPRLIDALATGQLPSVETAEKIVRAHPDSWVAWALLAYTLSGADAVV